MRAQDSDDIQALRHGLTALRLMNFLGPVSVPELARALDSSRGSAHRVLKTLADLGYAQPFSSGRAVHYAPTVRVRALSSGFVGDVRLVDVARPLMLAHTAQHGFPLALSTPAGDHCFIRFNTDSATSRVLRRFRAGFFASSLVTAGGMLCLAHQPEQLREAVINRLSIAPTAGPGMPPKSAELRAQLERIRRDDYTTFRWPGEREGSIAVPLRWRGTVIAALVLRHMIRVSPQVEPKLELMRDLARQIEAGLAAADAAWTGPQQSAGT
jgi:IclR family mhp operon transcriptional activator